MNKQWRSKRQKVQDFLLLLVSYTSIKWVSKPKPHPPPWCHLRQSSLAESRNLLQSKEEMLTFLTKNLFSLHIIQLYISSIHQFNDFALPNQNQFLNHAGFLFMSKILNLKETYKWHKYDYEETKKKKELWLYYLRNFPLFSGQFSEPLLSKGLSPLSFRFLECLPLFL